MFLVLQESTHGTYDHGRGTRNGAQRGRNTKDWKNEHPITPNLIIILIKKMTYFKSTTEKVHNVVDSSRNELPEDVWQKYVAHFLKF